MYSSVGRPSIPSEQLIRGLLLQVLFTTRSEGQLVERLDYDLADSTYSKNRDRLMTHEIAALFFDAIKKQAYAKKLMSREHFSVDGTLLEACASMKSLRAKDGSEDDEDGSDFHGKTRSNETHESTTDSDAKLFRKAAGKETKVCHMGHIVTENRNGLIAGTEVTSAGTRQEWGLE